MKITIVWMSWISWNFVSFHEIPFQINAESFSFLSSKTKKVLLLKKYFLGRSLYSNMPICCPNFQRRFWCSLNCLRLGQTWFIYPWLAVGMCTVHVKGLTQYGISTQKNRLIYSVPKTQVNHEWWVILGSFGKFSDYEY